MRVMVQGTESHLGGEFLQEARIVAEDGQLSVAENRIVEHLDQTRVGQNFTEENIQSYLTEFYHNDVARYVAHWREENRANL